MSRTIICTTDGPEKGCEVWDHDQHVDARHSLDTDPGGWGREYGAGALDEIERLRAESARRMVWLENEQQAHEQTHAALIDMTERAAKPEITDDMVERAAWEIEPYLMGSMDGTDAEEAAKDAATDALNAALNPGEDA